MRSMIARPIDFVDEEGVRWTVVSRPAPRADSPDNEILVFTSEEGVRRTCTGCCPLGGTWDDVEDRVWRTLLHYAHDVAEAQRD